MDIGTGTASRWALSPNDATVAVVGCVDGEYLSKCTLSGRPLYSYLISRWPQQSNDTQEQSMHKKDKTMMISLPSHESESCEESNREQPDARRTR